MTTPAKAYLIGAGFQVSQADAYCVLDYSREQRLDNADHNACKAILKPLYQLQTTEEKRSRETVEANGAGIAKFQARILSEFAQSGTCDSLETVKKALAYHWAQLIVLHGWANRDCYGALDAGRLTCRNYAGKGTDTSKWPPRD